MQHKAELFIKKALHNALQMLAPPHMAHAREYVLNVDMAVDIMSLSCKNSLDNVATVDIQRALINDAASTLDMKLLLVPSVNVAGHCCGIAVVDTCASPPPDSDAPVVRWSSVGRFVRKEAGGEFLFVTTSLNHDMAPSVDGCIRVMWGGAPHGKERRRSTSGIIECDAALFNEGRFLESVKSCDMCPRQVTSRCLMCCFPGEDLPAAGAAPTRLCQTHLPLRQPATMMDFTHNLHNTRVQEGLSVGDLTRATRDLHGTHSSTLTENIISFMAIRVGKDQLLIRRLLKVASDAHIASIYHVVSDTGHHGEGEAAPEQDAEPMDPTSPSFLSAMPSSEPDISTLVHSFPEQTDVDLFGYRAPVMIPPTAVPPMPHPVGLSNPIDVFSALKAEEPTAEMSSNSPLPRAREEEPTTSAAGIQPFYWTKPAQTNDSAVDVACSSLVGPPFRQGYAHAQACPAEDQTAAPASAQQPRVPYDGPSATAAYERPPGTPETLSVQQISLRDQGATLPRGTRRGGKPVLSPEEAEYRKKMSNRASAARSNARRRKAYQALAETLAAAKAQLEDARRKHQRLQDQNEYLKELLGARLSHSLS